MIAIDLITGFLGAGKTTFLRKYVSWLLEDGLNVCILENDYGAINTDVLLLQDLRGEKCEIEMVVGGDGYEAHRRRLKTKLISMAMTGYDRVVMEPSGIFDTDELTDLLCEEPLDRWYRLENVIAVVDASADPEMSEEAGWLMVSQTADAGIVVMSKTQLISQEKCREHLQALNARMEACGCRRRFGEQEVLMKDWETFTEEDRFSILKAGHRRNDYIHLQVARDNEFESLFYFRVRMSAQEVLAAAQKCLDDSLCGHVIRVKGSFKTEEAEGTKWYLLNATREQCSIVPSASGQEVIIVIGEKLCKDRIDGNWVWEGLTF